jgi:hypothetical protein
MFAAEAIGNSSPGWATGETGIVTCSVTNTAQGVFDLAEPVGPPAAEAEAALPGDSPAPQATTNDETPFGPITVIRQKNPKALPPGEE